MLRKIIVDALWYFSKYSQILFFQTGFDFSIFGFYCKTVLKKSEYIVIRPYQWKTSIWQKVIITLSCDDNNLITVDSIIPYQVDWKLFLVKDYVRKRHRWLTFRTDGDFFCGTSCHLNRDAKQKLLLHIETVEYTGFDAAP